MTDWVKYWQEHPAQYDNSRLLEQVGKTVNKMPIPPLQFELLLSSLRANLELRPTDAVLDLCCGNGLITQTLAAQCASVTGVDFSEPLIHAAEQTRIRKNIEYLRADVRDIGALLQGRRFDRIYMYEALQHFDTKDLGKLMPNILGLSHEHTIVLICSVPDRDGLWKFYNTAGRKLSYLWRSMRGNEAIGTWWSRRYIRETCKAAGFDVRFLEQDPELYTAHYRFDIKIVRSRSD